MSGKTQQNTRRRKRPTTPVYSSLPSSFDDKDSDFVCPICFDMIEEAFMTKCGHSFCHKCIKRCLETSNRCPKCNFVIEKKDDIFPKLPLLNELILKHRQRIAEQKKIKVEHLNGAALSDTSTLLLQHEQLDLGNINCMLDILAKRKQQLEGECKAAQNQILKEFLQQVHRKKQQQHDQLKSELGLVDGDLNTVENHLTEYRTNYPHVQEEGGVPNGVDPTLASTSDQTSQEVFNGSRSTGRQWLHTTMAARRKKVYQHFDDLETCYFSIRRKELAGSGSTADMDDSLEEFTESLSKFTRYSCLRPLATLNYASDIYNTSSIVSSIEFDRDCDYFAIAGVTKKIKVFEYNTVIMEQVAMHYPVTEMLCNSKISSIIWSSYHKGMLASSDYEGTVTLWDAFTGTKSRLFQEHEKRCWSVDFNKTDPQLLASGSDDSKVKLWYTNMEHSVASLEAKANVCCVKFNPESRYHLAFGSADHCVHYYDLRNIKQPLATFKGHRKAVSYTKFVNSTEIVSASTDSQLKLWNVNKPHCLRTFRGHSNEKNFVGLATDGDYVACGSENNSLYIYYKGLSKQLLMFKFDTVRSVLEKEKKDDDDANEFVSAVCWRPGSSVVVAANSQGIIKVLELV
ncbi:E3 ubiquitin-protein ligase COP1 [Lamellibrachia satsuma]|nr:E3 ubiquitin-protein ligase COP1 [Lamellibrachia satsuma]